MPTPAIRQQVLYTAVRRGVADDATVGAERLHRTARNRRSGQAALAASILKLSARRR
jgi:hypothetical protein